MFRALRIGVPRPRLANSLRRTIHIERLEDRSVPAFVAATSSPVGPEGGERSEPAAVTVGDFNRDGKLDVATANYQADGVSVLLGKGNGSFKPALNFAAGDAPSSILAVDLNADGKLDLVTTNERDDTVSILLGLGTGKFKAAVSFSAGLGPVSVAAGDVNGDGKIDLAVANNDASTVKILLGDGTGKFTAGQSVSVGANPTAVVLADFNSDNILDIASVGRGFEHLRVNLNAGNGTFLAPVHYETGFVADSLAVGYFNNDSLPDLAVGCDFPSNDGVSILLGNANGTFQPFIEVDAGGQTPASIAVADFNADGFQDVVTANDQFANNSVSVILGNGDGTFDTATVFTAGQGPVDVAVGDFNADGFPDVVTADKGTPVGSGGPIGTVTLLLGHGDGTVVASPNLVVESPGPIISADFNGDQKADLAVVTSGVNYSGITVFPGLGNGGFGPRLLTAPINQPTAVSFGDFNGDQKVDLAVTRSDGVSILLGNGDGTFSDPVEYAVGNWPAWAVADDFNGDQKLDLAIADSDSSTGTTYIMLGLGNGTFAPPTAVLAGGPASYLQSSDFNNDGKRDLAVVNTSSDQVSIVLGTGTGTFGVATSYGTRVQPNSVGIGDFNRDGKSDLAIPTFFGTGGSSALAILQNTSSGAFAAKGEYATDSRPMGIALADFTGDGKLDLVLANNFADNVFVFPGTGTGTFGPAKSYTVGDRPTWLTSADFNGDGRPDLAVVNSNAGTVTLLQTQLTTAGFRVHATTTTTTAGQALVVTVSAVDAAGHIVTNFAGAVKLTSTDGKAKLPGAYQFTAADQGTHRFLITLRTSGQQNISAFLGSLTGVGTVTVEAALAKTLQVAAPLNPVAGTPFDVTVTARDKFGNIATSYTGTVHFSLSGLVAGVTLPSDYQFTEGDEGVHTFTAAAIVEKAGKRKLTATTVDGTVKGRTKFTVVAGELSKFAIVGIPSSVGHGVVRSFTVIAQDAFGNTIINYSGTVQFTNGGGGMASLPNAYTFTANDKGKHAFKATFLTIGPNQSLKVTDLLNPSITGTVDGINVT